MFKDLVGRADALIRSKPVLKTLVKMLQMEESDNIQYSHNLVVKSYITQLEDLDSEIAQLRTSDLCSDEFINGFDKYLHYTISTNPKNQRIKFYEDILRPMQEKDAISLTDRDILFFLPHLDPNEVIEVLNSEINSPDKLYFLALFLVETAKTISNPMLFTSLFI